MAETIHVVIMGVAGCGKTTVAGILQDRWGWDVAEADEFHPQANVDKMHSGIPLTDEDRWPWLETIRAWMTEKENEGRSTIVTCSALKKSYRDVLRRGGARVLFMHLDGDRDLLASRLAARTGHFMPASLLDSQYATLEPLQPDELGAVVDIAGTPTEIANDVQAKIKHILSARGAGNDDAHATADVGVYGLGVMGAALARNLAGHFTTAVTNIDPAYTDRFMAAHGGEGRFVPAVGAAEFVANLRRPRKILLMVTAGPAVDSVLAELSEHLDSGDVVVDMGNSHFRDTRRREVLMRQRGIQFVGCGTSGGEEGALTGPALMVGGTDESYAVLRPVFEAIAARAGDGTSCAVHVGPDGAGHLTKTLHNGIEYAEMQVIAEVYHLLRYFLQLDNDAVADVLEGWADGELSSYLLEISGAILRTGGDFIDQISDRASHKGTGAWSTMIGVELGVDVSMLAGALFARFASTSRLRGAWAAGDAAGGASGDAAASAASYAAGAAGDAPRPGGASALAVDLDAEDLRRAMWLAKLVAYAQGLEVIRAASAAYDWNVDLSAVCRGWRAGCIIRCAMLDEFARLVESGDPMDILTKHSARVEEYLPSLRKVVSAAALAQAPILNLPATLAYLDAARSKRLPTALIQAQRDYFGAHGFEMLGKEGLFHGPWQK